MTKTAFAVAIAALLMLAASGTSQAVPIAPPTGVSSTDNGATIRKDQLGAPLIKK